MKDQSKRNVLSTFSPKLVHRMLLDQLQLNFRDVITIARLLTPETLRRHASSRALELIETADSANLRLILSDPSTISWIDTAGHLIRAQEERLPVSPDWGRHLRGINFIAGAAACLRKSRFTFNAHLEPHAAIRVPIIGALVSNATARAVDAKVQIDARGGIRIDDPHLKVLVPTEIANHEFAFRHADIAMPALPGHRHLLRSEFDVTAWRRILEPARVLIQTRAKWHDLVTLFGRVLGPLQSGKNYHLSVSFRTLPKVIFLAHSQDPLVIAEVLVHEADHNLLYAIDRRFSFWKDGSAAYEPVHWSPWRNDLRPLDGNLRGASAFTSVSEFLLDVYLHSNSGEEVREIALKRSILTANQVREALNILFKAGTSCFTEAGRTFLAQLSARLEGVFRNIPHTEQARSFQEAVADEINSKKFQLQSPEPLVLVTS